MYRPLPENLTIKESTIEGIGLFAVKDIAENTDLGITPIRSGEEIKIKYRLYKL